MKGELLRKLRQDNKLTQNELGSIVGVSGSSIRMFELNKRTPSLKTIKLLADFFHVSIEYLESGTEDEQVIKNTESVVSSIIDKLIENKVITNPNKIDKDVEQIILYAVKSEIENKLGKKKD